jgi:hypothetical protein
VEEVMDTILKALNQIANLDYISEGSEKDALRAAAKIAREALAQREAQEPVAWALIEPSGHVTAVRIDRGELIRIYRVSESELTPLIPPPPAQVPDDIARDAERYRWLRANCRANWDLGCEQIEVRFPFDDEEWRDLDDAIDRALLAKQEGK